MKKVLLPLVAVLLLSFTSCDNIKSLADVSFDVNLTTPEMTITPPIEKVMGKNGYTFELEETIDPTINSDIKKYLKKIKKWDIQSLQIEFVSVSEEGTKFDKGTLVEFKGSGVSATLTFDDELEIKKGATIDVPSEFFDNFEKILETNNKFDVKIKGGTNNYATIKVKVNIDVTITANPL
ncbi:MAG: hypothetical protein KAH10_08910 [Flavobacteriales bacterium]|nr:hypothetical protein [Flavobacteriales bacterium]